jgi:deferrochelatase/peroxidase EfeB
VAGADNDRHPIVRRGMPYGPKYDPRDGKADDIERGLLGLFVCVSLEDQFEFLMTNWINRGGFRPELPSATQDLIAGNSVDGEAAFVIPGSSSTIAMPRFSRFVTTKGAAYCFLPSITGLKYIAAL